MKKILLIEDDRMISDLIKTLLEKSNYIVYQVFQGDLAKQAINKYQPDLVILDIGLPELDGFHVCHEIRAFYQEPIIVLTARETDEDQISAFKFGADDFITKPVSPQVLKLRIEAMLRRKPIKAERPLQALKLGNLAIYPHAHTCKVDDISISLSVFEFKLLLFLMKNVGQVITRDTIYNILLKRKYNGVERTVDVRISTLREKMIHQGVKGLSIDTAWGQGYILNQHAV